MYHHKTVWSFTLGCNCYEKHSRSKSSLQILLFLRINYLISSNITYSHRIHWQGWNHWHCACSRGCCDKRCRRHAMSHTYDTADMTRIKAARKNIIGPFVSMGLLHSFDGSHQRTPDESTSLARSVWSFMFFKKDHLICLYSDGE